MNLKVWNVLVCVIFSNSLGEMPLNSLLKLIDRYVRQVPVKGSFVWFTPKILIMTANTHPSTWYSFQPCEKFPLGRADKEIALRRRIHLIYSYNQLNSDFDLYEGIDRIKVYWPLEVDKLVPSINEVLMPVQPSTPIATVINGVVEHEPYITEKSIYASVLDMFI